MPANQQDKQIANTKMIIRITGLAFLAAGFFGLFQPEETAALFNTLDAESISMISKIFLGVGFIDLIIVPKLLDVKEKE
jgi:hypothetical protein